MLGTQRSRYRGRGGSERESAGVRRTLEASLLKIVGFNPMRARSFRCPRSPSARLVAPDRRHHGAPFSEHTNRDYVRHVRNFQAFLGQSPDTATKRTSAAFSSVWRSKQISPGSINAAMAALRFLFTVTLNEPTFVRPLRIVTEPRRARVVLSQEEVAPSSKPRGPRSRRRSAVAYGAPAPSPSANSAGVRH